MERTPLAGAKVQLDIMLRYAEDATDPCVVGSPAERQIRQQVQEHATQAMAYALVSIAESLEHIRENGMQTLSLEY